MAGWATRQGSRIIAERDVETWAIFVEGSGMMHLVDSVSGEVLAFLGTSVQPRETVRDFVANLVEDSTITIEQIEERWLHPLAANGIIEEVP